MRVWLLILLACMACSIEERGAPGTDPDTQLELGTQDDSVEVRLTAPDTARAGADVPITITVRNPTLQKVELALGGREIAFDIVVSRGEAVVWQRLAGTVVPAILQLKTLQPGESFELTDVWRAGEPGEYDVAGKILTDVEPLQTRPVKITVTGR